MHKKNIVIIGLGGVGGYFGFKISQENEADKENRILFVARNKTYETVKKNGLKLISQEHENSITRPDAIYKDISKINDPDLIFICIKEYDLENVCKQLSKVITKKTILLPMMNGADIYDRIRVIIPNNIILPSCVYVASHIKEKGIVEHKGNSGKLIFGRDAQHFSEDIDWVIDVIYKSKIKYEFKNNALKDIWTKFIFIASFGLVTAKYNSSIGAVCSEENQKREATEIMREIKRIADKKGIILEENIIEKTFEKASSFPPETPTSLQLDINSQKENKELELFTGAIIKYGTDLKVKYTYTQKIYDALK